jgi:hypothetical protein
MKVLLNRPPAAAWLSALVAFCTLSMAAQDSNGEGITIQSIHFVTAYYVVTTPTKAPIPPKCPPGSASCYQ